MGATAEMSAAAEVSTVLNIPRAMTETQGPTSIVSPDNMDNLQTPTTTKEDTPLSASPMNRNASSKETPSFELSNIRGPTELVNHDIPLDGGMKQQYFPNSSEKRSSSHTVSPTEILALTESSSIGASVDAESSNQETVPTIISHPSASKDPLDSVAPEKLPKKKKKIYHKKQHTFASEDHHGADAAPSPKPNRISGETKSTIKQTMEAPGVDQASRAANAELAQVDKTPFGNSQGTITLPQEPNVPFGELNGPIPAAREQAISGVATDDSRLAARKKGRSWPNKRRPKKYSPGALSDRKTPVDAGNVKTRPPKNQVRETPSQSGGLPGREPQPLVLRTEIGPLRNADTEQVQASKVQVQEQKIGGMRKPKYAPPLSSIEETAIPQALGTSRTVNEDLDARLNGPNGQLHSTTKAGDNLINNGVDATRILLSSNTRQPTTSENVRRVLIPKSRYKVRRIPVHAKEYLTQPMIQDAQEEPSSRNLANILIPASDANKDVVKLPVDATPGKVLLEKGDDNTKIETGKGKPTPSQKNRNKMRRRKEQARAAAGSIPGVSPGVSMQSGVAQAQPNHSAQPHTTEEPSQTATIPTTNLTMNQDTSFVTRRPISAIGQIQNLLRGMQSDHRTPSRSSSMGRSRGNRPAQGRVIASGGVTDTGLNQMQSFGHQTVERRQRGFQPQGVPATADHVPAATGHVTANPSKPISHQRQHGTSAIGGSTTVAASSLAVQIITMDASTPKADPVQVEQAPGACTNQSPREAKNKSDVNSTRPKASVLRSATSTTLVASPPAAVSDWDTPSASPEHLDWSKSITPNNFSLNDLPKWSLQPTFSSRERKNSMVHPQPALSEMLKDTVPYPAKGLSMQAKSVKQPSLKENENPSIHPRKAEIQNPQMSQGRDAGKDTFIPPHLRAPSPLKQLVDVPADVAALTALAEFEEEDAHLPPHLRRPARKDKPLKASPVSFVAAEIPQGVLSESNGHLGNQPQHGLSVKTGQGCVATPSTLTQGHDDPANTQVAVITPSENPLIESVLPAVPERVEGRSKAFDNVTPPGKVSEQVSNALGSASIDSNVAVNDGETRPRMKLQYEPQLHDWEGNWAPAPVEWDARPSFDNTDARHLKAMEGWLDERAEAALNEPIQINIRDPDFLNGSKPAGGLEKLDLPVEDEVSETLLPNDPFTHARIHQTAKDSALAYHKKVYKEKKLSKEDRRAFRVATKLHYESYVPPPNPHVPKANIYIRPAVASDMRQITQIYNHYVKNSVVASERVELTEAQWQTRWRDATGEHFAFLVAVLKSGNRGGRLRRDNVETIVGFAYAEDFSESGNMYRFTCELQFWVHHQHLRHGIGKTLVDRMIAALDNGYYCRQGTDFIADNPIQYEGGGLRTIARILISIPHDPNDAKDLTWQKKWLSQWQFEQVGNLPGIGRKFEKDLDVAHLMKITSVIVPKAS